MPYASDDFNDRLPYAFENELEWLRGYAPNGTNALMIGAGPGIMAMALREGNPDLNLTVVDIKTCYYAQAHLESTGIYGVNYVVDDSAEYGKDYIGPDIDFLLVDGDHSKQGVINDVQAWKRHLTPTATLFFHDYININDDPDNGVKQALTEILERDIIKVKELDRPGISIVYKVY